MNALILAAVLGMNGGYARVERVEYRAPVRQYAVVQKVRRAPVRNFLRVVTPPFGKRQRVVVEQVNVGCY